MGLLDEIRCADVCFVFATAPVGTKKDGVYCRIVDRRWEERETTKSCQLSMMNRMRSSQNPHVMPQMMAICIFV